MEAVVPAEAIAVHGVGDHVQVGGRGGEALALAEVVSVGAGDADEGVHTAGVAAEHLVDGHAGHGVGVHEGMVGVDGVDAENLRLADGRVKHNAGALMVVNDADVFPQQYLDERGAIQVHGGTRASSSRNRDRSSPLSCFLKEDSTHAARCRKRAFLGTFLRSA